MTVRQLLKNNIVVLDGGLGTLLQAQGLKSGEKPTDWNITNPEAVTYAHKSYYDSGSNIVSTNTFSADILHYEKNELEKIISAAFDNIRAAKERSSGKQEKFIAFDIGPTGKMLKPYGDLDFEDAVNIFKINTGLAKKYGADLILIETMGDIGEARAALIAAKETTDLPVFVSCAYGEDGKMLTGTSPSEAVLALEALGADAIGVNCSFGPDKLMPVIEQYIEYANVPVIFKPNAGMPDYSDGNAKYNITSEQFADYIKTAVEKGVKIIGGCCGTTPEHILKCSRISANFTPQTTFPRKGTYICSSVITVKLGDTPVIIGERINPTGRKILRKALEDGNYSLVFSEAVAQQEKGADILDVNAGAPGTDEAESFKNIIPQLQSICELPLQIDTSDSKALETALRLYNGKALINSVNGKTESMQTVFPIAKKYGGTVIALTLDENGIPHTADERIKIAERIIKEAENFGISKENIVFDALVMAVSADNNAAKVTLETVRLIKEKLGCKTALGVSNISFGLPDRDTLNSIFLTCALNNGLDAAIANPCSDKIMSAYRSFIALTGKDTAFEKYIGFVQKTENTVQNIKQKNDIDLKTAVINGLKENAENITKELIKNLSPTDIANNELIPALDEVGKAYESGKIYLPGLLMSAEAAKASFNVIKSSVKTDGKKSDETVIVATVEGDIHDIGKNIVKLLLENYGFDVCDLGMNVPPQTVADKTVELNAKIVGLSALMTTTLPAMEKTVELIKKVSPQTKIIVGGAVLTPEYANKINADFYAGDATQTVELSRKIISERKF